MQTRSRAKHLPRQRGLAARGTFERRERAQELSSAVPMLVQEDAHENESKHDHLTTQPLQWLPDATHSTPSASQCGVSIGHCTAQAKGTAAHRADRTRDDESLICALYFECERNAQLELFAADGESWTGTELSWGLAITVGFKPAGRLTLARSDDVAPRALLFPRTKVAWSLSHEREATTSTVGSSDGHRTDGPSGGV